jgi:hypothetical protein
MPPVAFAERRYRGVIISEAFLSPVTARCFRLSARYHACRAIPAYKE